MTAAARAAAVATDLIKICLEVDKSLTRQTIKIILQKSKSETITPRVTKMRMNHNKLTLRI
ncbi:MAG TPA: hypothetical protein VFJ51_07580 [Nitrososphaeraceae archaeon]|nr:hypothetical protein [Nitrososphaeraceae archaeon]